MSVIAVLLFLALAVPAPAAPSRFTDDTNRLEAIFAHADVWRTYQGPILAIELVEQTREITTYRFKTRESRPIFKFGERPEDARIIGYGPEVHYFTVTVRTSATEVPGVSKLEIEDVSDVTDQTACASKLGT